MAESVKKYVGQVDCVMCGYCCGYRRETPFGGASYAPGEEIPKGIELAADGLTIPVDDDDTCIYLEKLDNGFARCSIQNKKPLMCKKYYCLPKQKARQLQTIVNELREM